MDWRDEGALLSARPHGETSAIVEVFTALHGRHAGVVRGGSSRKLAAVLQPGTQVAVEWHARLEDHIGSFRVEPLRARTNAASDRRSLFALGSACALLAFSLPEREPQPPLYAATQYLLDALGQDQGWPGLYLLWELGLLETLGFGLDLSACAVSGATDDLVHVSPKSGRAVSRASAGIWADKLLPLPPCLRGTPPGSTAELLEGLQTTGHFLERRLAPAMGNRPLPAARRRFVEVLAREAARE
ncbi:DNA repair protein RecO [Tropicimonas sp. IMCC34043]|uniref:DNA repair protein RecO n=1 Tax=Tropicimonas sp. IMCC34043 TaxID=2248760 RepID=UPI000E272C30|nr:DNA repair protein RecO [Tropicimonas sp. IMCC34043]